MMPVTLDSHKGHVAILPCPFTSHPLIFLKLASKLASAAPEVQFSCFNTAKSNSTFFSTQNTQLPLSIKPYNVEDGIPEGFDPRESTSQELLYYADGLPENLKRAMEVAVKETGRRITCFLTDAFFSFSVSKIAEELMVPWVAFWIPSPFSLSAFLQMELISMLYAEAKAEGDQLMDLIPGMPPVRFTDLPPPTCIRTPSSALFLSMAQKIQEASALLLNSYEEINSTVLTNDLKSKFKNLLYVGCPSLSVQPSGPGGDLDSTGCISWLDGKKPASVVYISFGTFVKLPQMEIVALAEALEESGVPFLWSLNLKEQLPDGFLERISMLGTGKIAPWIPQSGVLAHPSTGVHITHCGYSSICESILGGVPMICRSDWADSHLNAKMVEEVWGIGVRVEGGAITKSGMVKNLETIFHHEKGKKIREAIASLKEVLIKATGPNGVAAKDFKTLLQIITSKE